MRILVVNAGSSSLKLSVLDADRLITSATLHSRSGHFEQGGLEDFIEAAGRLDAVGHRIVHGGPDFVSAVLVDPEVRGQLGALVDLAPLHQPKSLAALDLVSNLVPGIPAVACFDTAFHRTLPPASATYALPAEWRRRWPLRRFGFHGLSHAYVARRVPELLESSGQGLRIVSCHLGAGASVTAIQEGASIDTSMGFTPLDGLVMATRSGSVDPGLVLWLEEHVGMPPAEIADALEHRSGLVGLSGSDDMRDVLRTEAEGNPEAALAVAVYLHRLRATIAAMTAAMDGLDVLSFTGGVGEHSPAIRRRVANGLGFLGVAIDPAKNDQATGDTEIGAAAGVRALVVAAREDLQIAAEVKRLLT